MMIVYQLGPRKPSARVLVASALIFIAAGCTTTPNEVVDMNYTTGCWELFVEHERRIGGNYRIYPEGLHPSAFCNGLSMAKERGQLVPSLDQLARYLRRLRPGQVSKKPWKKGDVFIEELGIGEPSGAQNTD
ncbi:MAG: hypothetical protein ACO3JV_14780 [Pseudomonadales bacterium]